MSMLEDIAYYCEMDKPVGALLLTGKWGSGKTFFVEKQLKSKLNKYTFIRVSLFSMGTIEDLTREIKCRWIIGNKAESLPVKKIMGIKNALKGINDLAPDNLISNLAGIGLNINLLDFVTPKNILNDKKVVLVLDDIERSSIPIEKILGLINDYCENMGFNIILIADEDKIRNDKYNEFKEKSIQSTISFDNVYEEVVSGVCNDLPDSEYKQFVISLQDEMTEMMSPRVCTEDRDLVYLNLEQTQERKKIRKKFQDARPQNIRSLKIALRNFERLYRVLKKSKVKNIESWFFTFLGYTLVYKANLLDAEKELKNSWSCDSNEIDALYPGKYHAEYMTSSVKQWIIKGKWDERLFSDEVERYFKDKGETSNVARLKTSRIDYLEDNIVEENFNEYVEQAYAGKLTFEEYVIFVVNSKLSRNLFGNEFVIDWKRVNDGLDKRVQQTLKEGCSCFMLRGGIGDLNGYSDEECALYKRIKSLEESKYFMFEYNKGVYIKGISDISIDSYGDLVNKRYNCFDKNMAEASLEGFKKCNNYEKAVFIERFKAIWYRYVEGNDCNLNSLDGFEFMASSLNDMIRNNESSPIRGMYIKRLLDEINNLMKTIYNKRGCEKILSQN